MIKRTECPTCGNTREQELCDGCGRDVSGLDDVVSCSVRRGHRSDAGAYLFYCPECAPKFLPAAALGTGPGSDLPASLDPPATSS